MVVGGLYFIDLKNLGEPVSIKGFPVPASLTVRHLLKQNPIKKLTAKNFLIFQQITTQLCSFWTWISYLNFTLYRAKIALQLN